MYLSAPTRPHRDPFGEVIEAVGLGVAIFQTGQSILTSGDFSSDSSTVNYIHERTPPTQAFRRCTTEFALRAHHPRYFIDAQIFWFRLSYEYNGNDVRNAAIVALVDRSSSLYSSTFSVRFVGQAYSVPSAPVAEVLFQINGRWNPVGVGDVSFWGELKVRADGRVGMSVSSERNWVTVRTPPNSCPTVGPYTPPAPRPPVVVPYFYNVFFAPPGSDRVRAGDEQRLVQFYQSLSASVRGSIERGETPLRIEGHASTTQPGPANRDLSRRRAERVVRILRDLVGTNARFQIFALGEYRAGTADAVEAAAERRVQISFNYTVPGSGSGGP